MMAVRVPRPDELEERASRAVQVTMSDARVLRTRQLTTGSSSLTYAADLEFSGERQPVVIKVAPAGVPPVRNRDVLRQARLLKRLATVADVPVPRVLGCDRGAPVDVPPLFVMSMVPGESYEPLMSSEATHASSDVVQTRALAAARAAAALHRVAIDGPCFEREREVGLGAEVQRWTDAFSVVDPDLSEGSREVGERLMASIPRSIGPRIVHGDWRLGNMLCVGSVIKAIIDWEVWSLSDPRIDLAWLLLFLSPGHPHAVRNAPLPSPRALVEAYQNAAGVEVGDLTWFGALARYKHAAACALIVRNTRKLPQVGVNSALLLGSVPRLLRSARELLT